jgi:eukaryotic-like serine/threonine-protein kinase
VTHGPPDPSLVGQLFDGRYRIEALLGHGGMGAVYRAWHVHLEQRVALKVLRSHLIGDPVAARRLAREARGTYRLDSEHAVKVLDFGATDAGVVYLVMEHLDGRTVADELQVDGALAPARAARIAAQVCEALAAAHRLGFVHRDIKPDNVMLVRRGADPDVVKVLDFGLAKLIEGAAGAAVFSVAALTQQGVVFGTPEYMAPEQAMGHPLDGRADLYAVGATLFEMLTGRTPFVDPSPIRLLAQHVKAAPPALGEVRPGLDVGALEDLVRKCLAKDPAARPATADELAAALRSLGDRLPSAAPRVPAAVATSATVDVDAVNADAGAARGQPAAPHARSEGTDAVPTRGLRRATRVTIAAVIVMTAALGAVTALALRHGTSRSRHGSAPAGAIPEIAVPGTGVASATIEAPTPTRLPVDANSVDAHSGLDAPSADAAAAPRDVHAMERASGPRLPRGRPRDSTLDGHLAASEAARTAGNRLRQLAEADAALALDPRDLRARFLAGEALLETGDIDRACKYLRQARRLRAARTLLAAGRCPAD